MLKKPQNIYLPIDKFAAKIFKHASMEQRGEWVTKLALALSEEAEEPFAKVLLEDAQYKMYKELIRQWKFKAKQNLFKDGIQVPNEKQLRDKCIEEYGNEYLEAEELIAKKENKKNKRIAAASNSNADDVDPTASSSKEGENSTRCESLDTTDCNPDNNESVDAATRKDADEYNHAGNSGILKSRTSTDSTVYDQEPKSISTNEARQSQRTATAPLRNGLKSRNKAGSHPVKAAVRSLPPTVQEVYDFAEQQKIDKDDARDCFEMCESRQWADQYGELIGDWKGFIIGFCKSREEKRKSA